MFKRKIETVIENYLRGPREKILVIDGARQIGKSFIIRETSRARFPHYVEVNLQEDFDGPKLFSPENIPSTTSFYLQLSALFGDNLGSRDDTIVFLDEIQVYPHLLTLLKALRLERRFTYIASGSLLGVALRHSFIPMGAIDEVKMYPMDFEEFLWASHVGEEAIAHIKDCYENLRPVEPALHEVFLSRFREYLLCGGLPDAVKAFLEQKNIVAMRKVHADTFAYYKDDATKYDEEHKLKIARIYSLMASVMENKVKRIPTNRIDKEVRRTFASYQDEFDYLVSSGIALAVKAVSDPKFPLLESSAKNLIKLYYNDVGILTNILYRTNINAILGMDKGPNLGSVYETVAATELVAHGHELFYFDSKKVGEVDFLANDYDALSVLPIEIKSGNDQNNFRAIPKLVDPEGNYRLPKGYVLGNKNIVSQTGNLVTLPIYMVMFL